MRAGAPRVLAPVPVAAAAGGDAGDGLMFAWLFQPDRDPAPLHLGQLSDALALPDGVVWVHLNASASRAKQWLLACEHLPEPVRHDLLETDERTRLEPIGDAILGVIGDVVAGADPDPWRLSTLRFFAARRFLVSTRRRPVSCASKLARAVRDGRRVASTSELMVGLLRHAAESVGGRAHELGRDTDKTEDEVLGGRVAPARQRLGKARRRAAQLRRQVTLRLRAIDRLRARLPSWLDENDRYELLDVLDLMETLVDELNAIEQREGALESEIATRLGEETNRNLYILSVVTAIFLPMTLITGIFGMNVAGLPGLQDASAFWWVMLVHGAGAGDHCSSSCVGAATYRGRGRAPDDSCLDPEEVMNRGSGPVPIPLYGVCCRAQVVDQRLRLGEYAQILERKNVADACVDLVADSLHGLLHQQRQTQGRAEATDQLEQQAVLAGKVDWQNRRARGQHQACDKRVPFCIFGRTEHVSRGRDGPCREHDQTAAGFEMRLRRAP